MAIPGAELVGLDTVGDLATRKIFSPGVARFFIWQFPSFCFQQYLRR
jgi:hypothetical protein